MLILNNQDGTQKRGIYYHLNTLYVDIKHLIIIGLCSLTLDLNTLYVDIKHQLRLAFATQQL